MAGKNFMIWGPADGVIMNIDLAWVFPGQEQLSIMSNYSSYLTGCQFSQEANWNWRSISLGQDLTFLWFHAVYQTKRENERERDLKYNIVCLDFGEKSELTLWVLETLQSSKMRAPHRELVCGWEGLGIIPAVHPGCAGVKCGEIGWGRHWRHKVIRVWDASVFFHFFGRNLGVILIKQHLR